MMQHIKLVSRYTAVSAICVLLNNIILIAGEGAGIHYVWSTLVCFIGVGAFAYVSHAHFTFGAVRSWAGYTRYLGTQFIGMLATLALFYLFIDLLDWPMWVAAPVVTVLMFLVNFVATRWAVTTQRTD